MKKIVIMKIMKIRAVALLLSSLFVATVWGQTDVGTIPKIIEKDGHHALIVD
jgi:hypothetical protein